MTSGLRAAAVAVMASLSLLAVGRPADAQQPVFPSRPVNSTAERIEGYVAEASQRFGIPAAWIRAVMRVEGAGEIGATSPAGAMGLMQVMPQTYATLRGRLGLGANTYDAHDNIIAGAGYLREMHDRYGDAGFLAAYNAGPARYEEFRAGGRSLPSETILYMARLAPMVGVAGDETTAVTAPAVMMKPEEAPIFVTLRASRSGAAMQSSEQPAARLVSVNLPAASTPNSPFTAHEPSTSGALADTQEVATTTSGTPPSTARAAIAVQPSADQDDIFVHRRARRTGQ